MYVLSVHKGYKSCHALTCTIAWELHVANTTYKYVHDEGLDPATRRTHATIRAQHAISLRRKSGWGAFYIEAKLCFASMLLHVFVDRRNRNRHCEHTCCGCNVQLPRNGAHGHMACACTTKLYGLGIPPALWASSGSEVVSIRSPLPTLSPGLRSGGSGGIAGVHHFQKTIQNAQRKPPKVRR